MPYYFLERMHSTLHTTLEYELSEHTVHTTTVTAYTSGQAMRAHCLSESFSRSS